MTKSKNCPITFCNNDKKLLKKFQCLLNSKFPCEGSIPISEVPFKITKPGSYCVTKDFTITSDDYAILIQADNVILDLGGHTLTLAIDNYVGGIIIDERSNVTIKNGIIIGNHQTVGVFANSSQNIFIENVIFDALYIGLYLLSTNNITITNCVFQNMNVNIDEFTSFGILNLSSSNGVIENSFFINNNGLSSDPGFCIFFTYDDPTNVVIPSNWMVKNSQFIDSFVSLFNVNGLLIDNITSTITDPTFNLNFIVFGRGLDRNGVMSTANDVILRNSTFTNRNAGPGFDGVLIISCNNITLDNVAIDMNATNGDEIGAPFNASLHFGDLVADAIVNGAKINKVLINNTPNIGITIEKGSTGIVIDNTVITGAQEADILILEANNNVIKNCDLVGSNELISGNRNGIAVTGSAKNNFIVNNNITGNGGTAILFDADTTNNLAKNNNVVGNGAGIVDNGNNLLVDNNEFDNRNVSSQLRMMSKSKSKSKSEYTKVITPKLRETLSYKV